MIRGRVANVIKGFSRNRDHMRLTNFERVRGFDAEWKLLCRPPENNLPQFAPLGANRNLSANGSDRVSGGIFKRNVNVAVCLHFCVNDAPCKCVPFLL
jgi:hypothetical protein